MATRLIIFVLIALFWATIFMMMCGCSPQKRLNRLVRKHPELVDTAKKNIIKSIETRVVVDSNSIDSLGKIYETKLNEANKDIDSLIKIKDCEKIAVSVKEKIKYIDRLKKQTDTVYSFVKCEISPFTIDTLGMLIKVSYNQDKVYLDIKAKQAVINCEEKQFYDFWQFWVAVLLFLLAVYLKR
jgi:hypothetical protein